MTYEYAAPLATHLHSLSHQESGDNSLGPLQNAPPLQKGDASSINRAVTGAHGRMETTQKAMHKLLLSVVVKIILIIGVFSKEGVQ